MQRDILARDQPGDAEVEDLDALARSFSGRHEEVLRLDVTVHDARSVDLLERESRLVQIGGPGLRNMVRKLHATSAVLGVLAGCNTILDIDRTYRAVDGFDASASSSGAAGGGGAAGSGGAAGGGGGGEDSAVRPVWMKRFGSSWDEDGAIDIAVVDGDGIVVMGCFRDTIDFGREPLVSEGFRDLFVVKLDAMGHEVWSRRFGDRRDNCGDNHIAVAPDGNLVLAGAYLGTLDFGGGPLPSAGLDDVFVAKLDPGGAYVWSKRFGDADHQSAHAVAIDAGGNVIVTGGFYGSMDMGGGALSASAGSEEDAYLARLDPDGEHLWSKSFLGARQNIGCALSVDTQGNIVSLVHTAGSIELGDGELPMVGTAAVGLAKYTKDGEHLWSKLLGGAGDVIAETFALGPRDDIYVTGKLRGTIELDGGPVSIPQGVFLAKLDLQGDGGVGFPAPNIYVLLDVAVDGRGAVFAGGVQFGSWDTDLGCGPLRKPGVLAKLDRDLRCLWSVALGEGDPARGDFASIGRMAVDSTGAVVVVGAFNTTIELDSERLVSAGGSDLFVAKFPP